MIVNCDLCTYLFRVMLALALFIWLFNHFQAFQACIRGPPKNWRCRTRRPRLTPVEALEGDLHPLNFGMAMARRCALDRSAWQLLMEAASSF